MAWKRNDLRINIPIIKTTVKAPYMRDEEKILTI